MQSKHPRRPALPPDGRGASKRWSLIDWPIAKTALKQAFIMLRPDIQWNNPVMFVVEVGAFLTLGFIVQAALGKSASQIPLSYFIALDAWLFLTVLFANFATALAEARGKAQAESLRKARHDTMAFRLGRTARWRRSLPRPCGRETGWSCKAGQIIPGDGEIIEGIASVDESAITGESAPVIREAGGDRSGVTGGTGVLSDRIVVQITALPGESFLDQMIALVEGATRQRTPNEIALTLTLSAFTLIFLIVVIPLWAMAWNAETYMSGYLGITEHIKSLGTDVPTLIALLVCLIPTTIGALLAAIGIAGMERALAGQHHRQKRQGRRDRRETSTWCSWTRRAPSRWAIAGPWSSSPRKESRPKSWRMPASFRPSRMGRRKAAASCSWPRRNTAIRDWKIDELGAAFIPFSAQTRMSGVDLEGRPPNSQRGLGRDRGLRETPGRRVSGRTSKSVVEGISRAGGTPLVVADRSKVLGVVHLKDIVKGGIKERFAHLRKMGVRTVMITGDNPLTAAAIAAEAGVDDFIAQATPEDKARLYPQGAGGGEARRHDGRRDQRRSGPGARRTSRWP